MIPIKLLILGSVFVSLSCFDANAQVKVETNRSRIDTYPRGEMRILTPDTSVDFRGDGVIIRTRDDFYPEHRDRNYRSNTRTYFDRENHSFKENINDTCNQNERNSVVIRGSNQRVEQRINSSCQ